ncbi:helix-turn-helix domain-containing protein [Streptococcus suis]|uniref:helix-turn-helix domain-containing protein n=1 Tax=Streptococcus suis TaxID=1307 RepID=UPI000CF60162|nr:helix-turn-helix domain-containing protein [Streptococcus suis]
MNNILGERLKILRKQKNLSQKELAEGICEPSQLSKFERGLVNPSSKLLNQLAKRLEISMDYFFDEDIVIHSNLESFKSIATKLLEDRDYKELEYLTILERNNNSVLSNDDNCYLEWIDAILLFYNYHQKEEAISQLETLLYKVNDHEITYLNILNTLSNFYSLTNQIIKYETNYKKLVKEYQNKNLSVSTYLFGYIKIQYNYSYHLWKQGETLSAIKIAMQTIELCKLHHTSYQLAPLLTIVANAGEKFLPKDKRKEYYTDAKNLCKIYDNDLMYLQLEEALNKNFAD